ncbi:N-acetylneuraminate synthase [Gammaproteobacteria bacterium]|nr:N-acetylneuraminate synthase [Gammaproteobacteria bacterium]
MDKEIQRVLVIAEAGVNHNGDINLAKRLIDAAVDAGADAVKFQTFVADKVVTTTAAKADYQLLSTGSDDSQFDMLKKLELSPTMHEELVKHCETREIKFLSTAFDQKSLDYLDSLGLTLLKVPSGEITNLPFLRHVGSLGKPVVLSSGMASLEEVGDAVAVLERAGTVRKKITVMHCNTEYPTPMQDVNLRAMATIQDAFGVAVGYSDHTRGIEVPIAAVARGANVIEKHITLDRSLPGPDQGASTEPQEFKEMVQAIRNIEQALGNGIKQASPSEAKNILIVRRSLVATKRIQAGESFTSENISAKRPGAGISPMRWDDVIDRVAIRDFSPDELIEL